MNNNILHLSGIKKVDKRYGITLTNEVEKEIQNLLALEEKYKDEHFFKKCIYCFSHIEAKNDYCEIHKKRTLCFDLCDQFEKKMTIEEAEALDFFKDFETEERINE